MQAQKIESTKEHCAYCFDVLLAQLNKKPIPEFPSTISNVSCPLFVTWMKDGDDLRGCIGLIFFFFIKMKKFGKKYKKGTFGSKPLNGLLKKYALTSALNDSRFDPISLKEVPVLNCSVSLLVEFEKGKDALDWEIGKHGIEIFFEDNNEEYSATFLPEVADEEKWSKEETLKHLVRKAGIHFFI